MSTFISRGSGREGDLLLAALNQSFQEQGGTFQVLCCVRVSRCPLAVVVERKGESFRVIRVRVVEVAAELDGAIVVIVVVGVGAYQLGEIEARRRTIRFPEFVPVAFSCLAVLGGSEARAGVILLRQTKTSLQTEIHLPRRLAQIRRLCSPMSRFGRREVPPITTEKR